VYLLPLATYLQTGQIKVHIFIDLSDHKFQSYSLHRPAWSKPISDRTDLLRILDMIEDDIDGEGGSVTPLGLVMIPGSQTITP